MGVIAYQIKQSGKKKAAVILVESEDAVSNIPQQASRIEDLRALVDFDKVLGPIKAAAEALFAALKSSGAEIDLEFGVELGGKLAIPKIVEFGEKANVKVRLKWAASK